MANIIEFGGGSSELTGNANTGDVLSGKTFYKDDPDNQLTGSMTNNAAVSASVGVGNSYTIPAGYHNGSGTVTGPTLDGNATTAQVKTGQTFYSNSGTKLTGEMAWTDTSQTTTLTMGETKTVPAGYTPGGTITAPSLSTLTNPATASQILSGYEAYDSAGSQITGSYTPAYTGKKASKTGVGAGNVVADVKTPDLQIYYNLQGAFGDNGIQLQGSQNNSSWTTLYTTYGSIEGFRNGYRYYRLHAALGGSGDDGYGRGYIVWWE